MTTSRVAAGATAVMAALLLGGCAPSSGDACNPQRDTYAENAHGTQLVCVDPEATWSWEREDWIEDSSGYWKQSKPS